MNDHDLKVLPEYFAALRDGSKVHETRFNDRGFKVGDMLRLREWHPDSGYSGQSVERRVTYVAFPSKETPIPAGYVVMSLQPTETPALLARVEAAEAQRDKAILRAVDRRGKFFAERRIALAAEARLSRLQEALKKFTGGDDFCSPHRYGRTDLLYCNNHRTVYAPDEECPVVVARTLLQEEAT